MNNNKSQIFFGVALAIVFALSVFVLSPFLITLSLAVIISVLIHPIYKVVKRLLFKNGTAAALVTILLFYALILAPISLLSFQLFKEAQSSYSSLGINNASNVYNFNQIINENLKPIIPNVDIHLETYITNIYSWVISNLGGLFSGTFDIFLKILIITITMFFLLKDSEDIKKNMEDLVPISSKAYEYLVKNIKTTINSVIFGSIVIAVIQGVISGIGFYIFGIPNATLWGTVAVAAAFVPGLGTGALFIPMMIYAFLYEGMFQVIGLLLWAMVFINLIESFLRPTIIHKTVKIHPIFILFSILGGISLFGLAGSVLGPLILSLLFAMIRVYKAKEIPIDKEGKE